MAVGVLGTPIVSSQNPLVKRAASLRVRKYREREAAFLVEGADLMAAGLAAGRRPQAVFVTADAGDADRPALPARPSGLPADVPVHLITEAVARHITSLATPPEVMAVFAQPQPAPLAQLGGDPLVVYTDRVADPGNMGTLIRAAVAFGAAALVASPGSVDVFSPKVVRASMGAVFGLALYAGVTLDAALAGFPGAHVYGLVAHGGRELGETALDRPAVLCVGAERAGLSPAVQAALDEALTITLAGAGIAGVESLNAGIAGAIALYEFARRRSAADDQRPDVAGRQPAADRRSSSPALQRRRPHG